MQKNRSELKAGFTLIELSIVLVIIAIIISGVLVGQEIVNSAKVNNIVSDFSKYERLTNTFKLKYNYLPGDMPNAISYWPAAHSGDGDGKISGAAESLYAWEMMGFAGITGSYTGAPPGGCAGGTCTAGVNLPKSTYCSTCGFSYFSETVMTTMAWNANAYPNEPTANPENRMVLGLQTKNLPTGPMLTGARATQVDTKMDDGIAGAGRLLGGDAFFPGAGTQAGCVTTPAPVSPSAATYVNVDNNPLCALVYTLDVDDQ